MMLDMSQLEARTNIYIAFLQSLSLDDPSLIDSQADIILGAILTEPTSESKNDETTTHDEHIKPKTKLKRYDIFQEEELLMFGTPARHHLNASTRHLLLEDIHATLRSIAEFLHGDGQAGTKGENLSSTLPEAIQVYKDELSCTRGAIATASNCIVALLLEISEMRERLDHQLKQATTITFPAQDTARSASVDLLAATIESSLVKLSLIKTRSERSLYNHKPNRKDTEESNTVAHAIVAAYSALKGEEEEMKAETDSLDRQLQEYESLLQLVDRGSGGYKQIIDDWTKVKQETDECLKDLRRLGWTGD